MARFLWTQRTGFGPSARIASSMAFDSKRGRTVLFGGDGLDPDLKGDTWEWDGSFWTQMNDIGPSARRDAALAYDTSRGVTVLFGGRSTQGFLADTWQWDGQDWTQLSDSGPLARAAHGLAFDSGRNRTVLFGGGTDTAVFGDTWEFDGVEWTQQEDSGPGSRVSPAMAYDPVKARVFLFGGAPNTPSALGDTWAWDGTTWIRITEMGPAARLAAEMVSPGSSVILFGGLSSRGTDPPPEVFADTWEFDGKLWTQRQDIGPGPRWSLAMAFDSLRSRVVVFGGIGVFSPGSVTERSQLLGDTWEHTVTPVAPPVPSVDIQSITLTPISATAGQNVALQLTLTQGAASQLQLEISLVPASEAGAPVQPRRVNLPPVRIPAALTVFTTQIPAPSPPQAWVVSAQLPDVPGARVASATLTVT